MRRWHRNGIGFLLAALLWAWPALPAVAAAEPTVVAASAGAGRATESRVDRLVEAASLLHRDPSSALAAFQRVGDQDPNDALGHVGIGLALLDLRQAESALMEFRAAIFLAPDLAVARVGEGLALLHRQDRAGAGTSFAQALELKPDYTEARLCQAYLRWLGGDAGGALTDLANLGPWREDAPFWYQLRAEAKYAAGQREAAFADIRSVIALAPPSPTSRVLRTGFDFPGLKIAKAATATIPAPDLVIVSPEEGQEVNGAITVKTEYRGEKSVAYMVLVVDGATQGITNSPPHDFRWRALRSGPHTLTVQAFAREREMIAEARRVVFMPGKATVRYSYSEAAYQTAIAALERTAQPQIDQLRLYDQLARWHLEQRQTPAAIADLERVVAMDPTYSDARTRLIALRQPTRAAFGARVAIYGNGAAGKRVAFTFDDGPNPLFTPRILELLAQYGAKGTFFVVGTEANAYPDLVRRIAASGSEVASHTYSHANLAQQKPAVMQQEVLRNKILLRSIGVQPSDLVRPPGGNYGPAVREAMNQIGFRPVLWTCNASNFDPPLTAELVQAVLSHVHPGGIVLLHNGKDRTLELLPGLLAGLKARGYRVVTVSELIGNGH